jgi:hypothetical protein
MGTGDEKPLGHHDLTSPFFDHHHPSLLSVISLPQPAVG